VCALGCHCPLNDVGSKNLLRKLSALCVGLAKALNNANVIGCYAQGVIHRKRFRTMSIALR